MTGVRESETTPEMTALERLKRRLTLAYDAEERALEMQSTSNAEGEQQQLANLKEIRALISDLERQINDIENPSTDSGLTMYWELTQ